VAPPVWWAEIFLRFSAHHWNIISGNT